MNRKYVLVIDVSTTSVKVILFNKAGETVFKLDDKITQYYPFSGQVEQDAMEILEKTIQLMKQILKAMNLTTKNIATIGITNQRATSVIWNKETGLPINNAIVWQDTRAATYVEKYKDEWYEKIYSVTGSTLSSNFSSLHLKWTLDNIPYAEQQAVDGKLLFGTIDTWILWNLTNKEIHATSHSNASATGSYDIVNLCWYEEWLDALNIPLSIYPEVREDSGDFGFLFSEILGDSIPITALIADQQASLFAQNCHEKGEVKCTHGTGSFLEVCLGKEPLILKNGLNTLIAWRKNGETTYTLEGHVAYTGAAVQWLAEKMNFISSPQESGELAFSVKDNGGVYFVPAFSGLSAPHWDSYSRGMIIGISGNTNTAHIVRACLEGIAYSIKDFLLPVQLEGIKLNALKVDGGGSKNDFLLQFQSNLLEKEVERSFNIDATGLGAAFLAGLSIGYWKSVEECMETRKVQKVFRPQIEKKDLTSYYKAWKVAVKKVKGWTKSIE